MISYRDLKDKIRDNQDELNMGKKILTDEEKERLRKALGPFSDRQLESLMDYYPVYQQTQNENIEKAKILLGEARVNEMIKEDPNAMMSFHFHL